MVDFVKFVHSNSGLGFDLDAHIAKAETLLELKPIRDEAKKLYDKAREQLDRHADRLGDKTLSFAASVDALSEELTKKANSNPSQLSALMASGVIYFQSSIPDVSPGQPYLGIVEN